MFGLLALWWALDRGRRPGRVQHTVAALLFVAALLSYEPMVVLPFVLVITVLLASDRADRWRDAARAAAPLVLVLAVYFVLRWSLVSSPSGDFWLHLSQAEEDLAVPPLLQRLGSNTSEFVQRLLGRGAGLGILQSRTFWATIALLAGLLGVARLGRPCARLAVLGVTIIAFGFVPFATYIGFADRFAYFASVGIVFLLAVATRTVWIASRLGRIVAPVLIAVVIALWTRQLLLAGADWVEAGRIASELREQLVREFPDPPPGATLHLFGLPYTHGVAYVYITYFDLAMTTRYQRTDLRFRTYDHKDATEIRRVVRSHEPNEYFFVWDRSTRKLSRVVTP